MKKFRLATVLRARQAREDAAKGSLLQARAAARAAQLEAADREDELGRRELPAGDTRRAYLAAIVARQALAGELSAVRQLAARKQADIDARLVEFTKASQDRHIVDKLAERHRAEQDAADAHAEQIVVDELATSRSPRRVMPMDEAERTEAHTPVDVVLPRQDPDRWDDTDVTDSS